MAYDSLGNLVSMTANVPALSAHSGSTSYSYDLKNQLLSEDSTRNSSGYSYDFVYDSAGNPTTFRSVTQSFNVKNQKDATGFVYDDSGNPTTYSGASFTFDAENRATGFGSSLSSAYTGSGLRAWKNPGSNKTWFLYAGGLPVCELNASGNVVALNTFGANGLLARNDGTSSTFYTFDPQGI